MDMWNFISTCLVPLWLHRFYVYSAVAFGLSVWMVIQFTTSRTKRKITEQVSALIWEDPKNLSVEVGGYQLKAPTAAVKCASSLQACLGVFNPQMFSSSDGPNPWSALFCVCGWWNPLVALMLEQICYWICYLLLKVSAGVALLVQVDQSACAQCFHVCVSSDNNDKVGLVLGLEWD